MKEYDASLPFWNEFYKEEKPQVIDEVALGCPFLEEKLKELAQKGTILDFGCGDGWASIFMAMAGCAHSIGLDQAEYGINAAKESAKLNHIDDRAEYVCRKDDYLKEVETGYFQGCFSSNTLDVIPTEVALRSVQEINRVCVPDAMIVIMLNPYLDEAFKERTKMEQIEGNSYGKNGILRCVSRTKDEWITFFEPYFEFISYDEFRFDDEPIECNRRLFVLKNRSKEN